MGEQRLVIKRLPMRRATSIDPVTGEIFPIRVYVSEILLNGKLYGSSVVGPDEDEDPEIIEGRWRQLAIVAWNKMARQLLVEAGGPNFDDPDWHEDRTWIEGVAGD